MFTRPGKYHSALRAVQNGNEMFFFFNGCKEEYPNCKIPTFNSGKTIKRQVEMGLHEQYFFDEVQRPKGEAVSATLREFSQSIFGEVRSLDFSELANLNA